MEPSKGQEPEVILCLGLSQAGEHSGCLHPSSGCDAHCPGLVGRKSPPPKAAGNDGFVVFTSIINLI